MFAKKLNQDRTLFQLFITDISSLNAFAQDTRYHFG
jgi:hypothetical protein